MKLVDLSAEFYTGMPKPKSHPEVEVRMVLTPSEEEERRRGFTNKMEQLVATTHVSTHIDAPSHFSLRGKNIDDYPPDYFFMVPSLKLDIPKEEYGAITVEDLVLAERQCGGIQADEVVLLNTGAGRRTGTQAYLRSPYLTRAAAEYLAGKKVRMVGIDSFTVDDPREKEKPAHVVLLKEHGILIIEGVANLEAIPGGRFHVVALPLKIRRGSGAYARMVAVLNEQEK